ncbi:hydrogen gas-evolving membrane-bound hydrogenase subunit E [Candidatus Gromoviella agglomerans]|uniref:hydrogen gas-evolving membrane-bound hydrogenase subunit E n=1 Tax=Candidatus Gromoviella agglomerans TaxID=2806609 RepID=UPI001E3D91C8|nr:hydrogen gas-evolving membrane-bound hydrogenase subunit E [Candidatus Gromoviella agglomerans]
MTVTIIIGIFIAINTSDKKLISAIFLLGIAMCGVVISNNLIVFFTFWEALSIIGYFLVGFYNKSKKDAITGFISNMFGSSFMLIGFLVLQHNDIYRFSDLSDITLPPFSEFLASIFISISIAVKSAQFPLSFWLVRSMSASASVSAYLHSCTLIKAGTYLMLRLLQFDGFSLMYKIMLTISIISTIFNAIESKNASHIKHLLAITTMNQVSAMIFSICICALYTKDTIDNAIEAILINLSLHALYKSALFVLTSNKGFVLRNNISIATKDILYLVIAISTATWLPIINGAKSIWFIHNRFSLFTIIVHAFNISIFFHLFIKSINQNLINCSTWNIFSKSLISTHINLRKLLIFVIELLHSRMALTFLATIISFRIFFANYGQNLSHANCKSYIFFYGSTILIVFVLIFIKTKTPEFQKNEEFARIPRLISKKIIRHLVPHDNLSQIIKTSCIIISALILALIDWSSFTIVYIKRPNIFVLISNILTLFGLMLLMRQKSTFMTVIFAGLVGTGVGMIYLSIGAIDVAITHFLCESISLIFMMTLIKNVKLNSTKLSKNSKYISILFGFCIFLLFISMSTLDFNNSLVNSYVKSCNNAPNVVNMIITDYRGFDTWGEMMVLIISGLIIFSVLKSKNITIPKHSLSRVNFLYNAVIILAIILVFISFYMLINGHNVPGGGFIAGLILSLILIFCEVHEFLKFNIKNETFMRILKMSIAISIITSVTPLFFEKTFFTNMINNISLALFFDCGIMLSVISLIGLLKNGLYNNSHNI